MISGRKKEEHLEKLMVCHWEQLDDSYFKREDKWRDQLPMIHAVRKNELVELVLEETKLWLMKMIKMQ